MITVLPVRGLPEIHAGDDLVSVLLSAGAQLQDGDVLVVSQKIVSKAEGMTVPLDPAEDPVRARRRIARSHARRIVADTEEVLIVETAHGFVCANGGIDASNAPNGALVLLPADPDGSARRLRRELHNHGFDVGVIISDTFGRPWRIGQTDIALGVAGIAPLRDERGGADREGRPLEVTEVALADELAGAADLVRRKADGMPVVIIRGLAWIPDETATGQALVRPADLDLFPRGRGGLAARLTEPVKDPRSPVRPRDLERVLARIPDTAATVHIEASAEATEIELRGEDPAQAGLWGGLVLAMLLDLGYEASVERITAGNVRILAGR